MRQAHDCVTSGHFGISKTLAKVKQGFYWIGCRNDVKAWCKQCEPECYNEGVTNYGTKLAENIEQAHEFAREVLKTSSMRMKR